MNLKSIKLVGFKSFVDPTLIPITDHLTGIVGPNGCGKSNVVDAIRWVIGESSAKQLRGQSMADVIFNGSTHRKPVGMASVELIFDNSAGRITGEYAKFNEISIRREVHREGQSQYFLNGVSCRRRDIIDVFLGTGLGARSYSIIEQGMISELIEAKPDELRGHLEEVSGISKYKERRRETEIRMRHTQENLDRLNDLNEELSKQLRSLKRQAEAAERYTTLKQQERVLHAEIKIMHWQALDRQLTSQNEPLTRYQLIQDEQQTLLQQLETGVERNRQTQLEANSLRDQVQKQFYSLGAEVTRLEQSIQHRQEQMLQWRKEHSEVESLCQELEDHAEEQRQNIEELFVEAEALSPEAALAKAAAQEAGQIQQEAEQKMQQWQRVWDAFQTDSAKFSAQASVLKNNLKHYEQQLIHLNSRQEQLQERKQQLPLDLLTTQIGPLAHEAEERRQQIVDLQKALTDIGEAIRHQRQQNIEIKQSLDRQNQRLQGLRSRQASLEAIQQSALGYHDDQTKDWLRQNSLSTQPRLGKVLQVNEGWEVAVETVLGGYFDAVCLQSLDSLITAIPEISKGRLTLMDLNSGQLAAANHHTQLPLLSGQIQSAWPLDEWLSGVYIAENLTEAWENRSQLASDESIVTRDGLWLGKNWIRINKAINKDQGILIREQELKKLQREIEVADQEVSIERAKQEKGDKDSRELEEQRDSQHKEFQKISSRLTEVQAQLSGCQSRLTEVQQQEQRLLKEMNECALSIQNLQEQQTKTQTELTLAAQTEQLQVEKKLELFSQKEQLRQELDDIRQKTYQQRQIADELTVRLVATENQLALLKQNSMRDARQQQQLEERRELLANNLVENEEPLEDLRSELQDYLSQRLQAEQSLKAAQEALSTCNQQLAEQSKAQQQANERLSAAKTQWQSLQMERQALSVRQTTIQEQLTEQNWVFSDLITALPTQADLGQWEQQLETVTSRISRLGPINLAAITEFQTVNERKSYLDKQQADLIEALDILKNAISKIDRETRHKFQETFNQVNANFQALFPQIFGGGKAVLELLEEDWLTAGVIVKAQPPGKRNATIYMLSGGEKALTAMALVFAMFKLNPAPFCVLDEVDAPLDDMNTGRFCQLVKEMAKNTQFIVISHNKVTISMAERLMGVTMQEPGVSRIVSVNVAEAVALAEI